MAFRYDRRRFMEIAGLSAAAFSPAFPAQAANSPCAVTRVLFVCPLGVVQSVIAREELRRIAKARGLSVQVQSRGIDPPKMHPEADISLALATHLREEGIDPFADPLRRFSKADPDHADITIAFNDAALAPGLEHARSWKSPSWNDQYAEAKAALAGNLQALAAELATRPCMH
jgi:protein-tyrosine-phosphatase